MSGSLEDLVAQRMAPAVVAALLPMLKDCFRTELHAILKNLPQHADPDEELSLSESAKDRHIRYEVVSLAVHSGELKASKAVQGSRTRWKIKRRDLTAWAEARR